MPKWLGKFGNSVWGSIKKGFSGKNKDIESSRSRRRDESGPSRSSHRNKSGSSVDDDDDDSESPLDPLMWSKDLERHYYGEFSFAVVQGNSEIEDYSQVETGPNATFVGVYDGHGGAMTSHYIRDNLFRNLMSETLSFPLQDFFRLSIFNLVFIVLVLYSLRDFET